jgi:hypothetical protein
MSDPRLAALSDVRGQSLLFSDIRHPTSDYERGRRDAWAAIQKSDVRKQKSGDFHFNSSASFAPSD